MSRSRLLVQRSRGLVAQRLDPAKPDPHIAVLIAVDVKVPLVVRQLERIFPRQFLAPVQAADD